MLTNIFDLSETYFRCYHFQCSCFWLSVLSGGLCSVWLQFSSHSSDCGFSKAFFQESENMSMQGNTLVCILH